MLVIAVIILFLPFSAHSCLHIVKIFVIVTVDGNIYTTPDDSRTKKNNKDTNKNKNNDDNNNNKDNNSNAQNACFVTCAFLLCCYHCYCYL